MMKTVKILFGLILALFILISGVGICQDVDILDFLPAFIRAKFGNAVATPFYLVPGISTPVTITVYIPDANLVPESVQLKEGTAIIGNLTDSGNKVFSITTNYQKDKGGNINLSISATIGGVNKTIAQFDIPVISLPTLQNTTQYNQNIDNIFSTLVSAQSNFTTLKDESTTCEQSLRHLRLAKERLLSVYANMEGIYRAETQSPSNFPRWSNFVPTYGGLLKSANKMLTDRELVKQYPNDPRVASILTCANSLGLDIATPQDREFAAWYCQTHGPNSQLQGTLQEANKIVLKKSITQFTGLAGGAIGDLFGGVKGWLIGQGINAGIEKIIDIFISNTGEIGFGVGEVQDGESLEAPDGSHDVIFSFSGSIDRAIERNIPVTKDTSSTVAIAPGEVKLCKYSCQELPTLGGNRTGATAINNIGQIVGWSVTSNGNQHAFLWTPSTGMQDLGTLGGGYSTACGINSSGQVVGISHDSANCQYAFLWTPSVGMQNLGTLEGGTYSAAAGINSIGQVVGSSQSITGRVHAFLWTPSGGMQDLGTLGGLRSIASGINNNGQIVGWSYLENINIIHAFLWTPSSGMQDLGTLGGLHSIANGINSNCLVIGRSNTNTSNYDHHAFLWTPSPGMQDLGTFGGSYSSAHAINSDGQVVGSSTNRNGFGQPFLWTPSEGMIKLNDLVINFPTGVSLVDANAINDMGKILVNNGEGRSFLLTPMP